MKSYVLCWPLWLLADTKSSTAQKSVSANLEAPSRRASHGLLPERRGLNEAARAILAPTVIGVGTDHTVLRRAIGCALASLFCLLPFTPLLALAGSPDCQMPCCDRKHSASNCSRHSAGSIDGAHFEASPDCLPNCGHPILGPIGVSSGVLPSGNSVTVHRPEGEAAHSNKLAAFSSATDPVLHQRPPPLLAI